MFLGKIKDKIRLKIKNCKNQNLLFILYFVLKKMAITMIGKKILQIQKSKQINSLHQKCIYFVVNGKNISIL